MPLRVSGAKRLSPCFPAHLDHDLETSLQNESFSDNPSPNGKRKLYDYGTVAEVKVKQQRAYFVAIATLNEHGAAHSTYENLQVSLANYGILLV